MRFGWVSQADTAAELQRQTRAKNMDLPENRRKKGRFRARDPRCNLGELLDLSATGARVRSRKPVTGVVTLHLPCESGAVSLSARVVWTKQSKSGPGEYGLEFIEVTPAQRQALHSIAMAG